MVFLPKYLDPRYSPEARALWASRRRGALDNFPLAAGAYANTTLYRQAAGADLLTVRRSSDNESDSFRAAGMTGNLSDFVGTGATDQGFTTLLTNQGDGNNAAQTTAGSQPRVVVDGQVQTLGGIPILGDFDGTDDFLRIPYSSAWDVSGNQLSVIAVINPSLVGGGINRYILAQYDTTQNERVWGLLIRSNETLAMFFGDPSDGSFGGFRQTDTTLQTDTLYIVGATYNEGTVQFYINGEPVTGNSDGSPPSPPLTLFSSSLDVGIGCTNVQDGADNFYGGKLAGANFWPSIIDVPAAMDAINAAYGGAIY